MKAWNASAVSSDGQSPGNVVTQVSSGTESVESNPSAKSRETSPLGDELENEPDPETDANYLFAS
jgi:hypothetical protein